MGKKLEEAQDAFLEKVNRICNKFGLNNVMVQLYSILYFSGKPFSLDEMVERLKISKGSVSVNIRALERYGAVREVWVRGSRKDYYEAEKDISRVMLDRIKSMAESRISEVDEMISASLQILSEVGSFESGEKEAVDVFRQRLGELQALKNKARTLFNLLNSGILGNILKAKTTKPNKKEVLV